MGFIHAKLHSLLHKSDKVHIMCYVKSKHYGLVQCDKVIESFICDISLEITIWKIITSLVYEILLCCNLFYYWMKRKNYILYPLISTEKANPSVHAVAWTDFHCLGCSMRHREREAFMLVWNLVTQINYSKIDEMDTCLPKSLNAITKALLKLDK